MEEKGRGKGGGGMSEGGEEIRESKEESKSRD